MVDDVSLRGPSKVEDSGGRLAHYGRGPLASHSLLQMIRTHTVQLRPVLRRAWGRRQWTHRPARRHDASFSSECLLAFPFVLRAQTQVRTPSVKIPLPETVIALLAYLCRVMLQNPVRFKDLLVYVLCVFLVFLAQSQRKAGFAIFTTVDATGAAVCCPWPRE